MSDRMRYALVGVTAGVMLLAWGSLIVLLYAFSPPVAVGAFVVSIGGGTGLVVYGVVSDE
jgi:hypothetical protein